MNYLCKSKKKQIQYPVDLIVDSRERKESCWQFDPKFFVVTRKRLRVGDYTIKSFEHILTIERKSSFNELITNIGRKRWFESKLINLSKYPIKYLLIEDDFSNLPRIFKNLQYGQIQPVNLFNWFYTITQEYNIPMLFIGKRSQYQKEFVELLLRNILRNLYYGKHRFE